MPRFAEAIHLQPFIHFLYELRTKGPQCKQAIVLSLLLVDQLSELYCTLNETRHKGFLMFKILLWGEKKQ